MRLIDKVLDWIEVAYSGFLLLLGVMVAAFATTSFMLLVALPIGVPMAFMNTKYWHEVWIGFDKLWNAILGGDHKETISSRLGKSVYYDYPPVFLTKSIDKTVSWMLSQVDPQHCKKSIDWRVGRSL